MGRIAAIFFALLLAGCTTVRVTEPPRTATEELLISSAADRAAEKLSADISPRSKVFVDSQYFEGTDAKYAVAAIRDRLLREGANLTDDRKSADTVIEIRSGAQSINNESTLIGIPSFQIPIPLAGSFTFPEIALYKEEERTGVAKMAMTGYGEKDGKLELSDGPEYGFSHRTKYTVLFFVSWTDDDSIPKDADGG